MIIIFAAIMTIALFLYVLESRYQTYESVKKKIEDIYEEEA